MSLRGRVIGLIGLVLLASSTIYVLIAWRDARTDLADELEAARTGGQQTVHSAFEDLPRSDHPARDLRQLVATFDGNRHVQASVIDLHQHTLFASRVAFPDAVAPQWFARALRPDIEPTFFAVPGSGGLILRLRPEPASDLASLWSATRDTACIFALAVLAGLALTYWVIGRALAPLTDLSRGLNAIGAGRYEERVREAGPPELHDLQRGFNTMAGQLAEIDTRNRVLEAQLLTIQDEERAEIARDLHDEIGPYLFAVALDAEMIGRNVSEGNPGQIAEQVRSIQNAVSYVQRQVRELIARLRPTRAAELGLQAALGDLVMFWQARQPEVQFERRLDSADDVVPERLRDVIYRLVQEAVANALRHAHTTQLSITIESISSGLSVSVVNVGTTRPRGDRPNGLGLIGMRERVQTAGGDLEIQQSDRGWSVIARFSISDEKGGLR